MYIKDFLGQAKKLLDRVDVALFGEASVNIMNVGAVQHIEKRVREQTGYEVCSMDTRAINIRKNVGIIMPLETPRATVNMAKAVFIAAAREQGVEIAAHKVLLYVPGTKSSHKRLLSPPMKVWGSSKGAPMPC